MTSINEAKTIDPDLAEQAQSGHGVPSQDPDPAAQVHITTEEAKREADSTLVGGGAVVGMAAGGVVGAVVAGPVGAVVGATVGSVVGAVGGVAASHGIDRKAGT